MKVLNLYAGIGGNRKLWENVDVTAVEYDENVAEVYKDFFPNDRVIVTDAHEYLLNHYSEYDFIWSSPPCPTHSDIRRCGVHSGQYKAEFPDMKLYQEIILLQNFAASKTKWVVENVIPYYEPLIQPTAKIHRHLYWANFYIPQYKTKDYRIHNDIAGYSELYGFNIRDTGIKDKRKALRNMVNPELGLHILNAYKPQTNYVNNTQTLFEVN